MPARELLTVPSRATPFGRRFLFAALLGMTLPARGEWQDPAQLVAQLEARLASSRRVVIDATIESRGLIAATLAGQTELLDRNRAKLAYSGTFTGQPAYLGLDADGRSVTLRNGSATRAERAPAAHNHALVVGFMRMGLMHNVARLTGLQAPDHGGGGAELWVTLDSFRPTTYAQSGDLEGFMSFGFDIIVDGQVGGNARLWLDPATGLPRRRHVTVRFPQGDLIVVEDYTRFVVE